MCVHTSAIRSLYALCQCSSVVIVLVCILQAGCCETDSLSASGRIAVLGFCLCCCLLAWIPCVMPSCHEVSNFWSVMPPQVQSVLQAIRLFFLHVGGLIYPTCFGSKLGASCNMHAPSDAPSIDANLSFSLNNFQTPFVAVVSLAQHL